MISDEILIEYYKKLEYFEKYEIRFVYLKIINKRIINLNYLGGDCVRYDLEYKFNHLGMVRKTTSTTSLKKLIDFERSMKLKNIKNNIKK